MAAEAAEAPAQQDLLELPARVETAASGFLAA
jgi:hypothetical protein